MPRSCVARHPIYDASLNRIGYELLYRAGGADVASIGDGRGASERVILDTFIHIGFDNLVGSSRAFINIPETLLLDDAALPMFPAQTTFEIPNDIKPTPEVLAGIRRLKERGFGIALDNFQPKPELEPLLDLADYVKVDVLNQSQEAVAEALRVLRNRRVKVIAQRVETGELLARCRILGFGLFQGFFFCKPQVLDGDRPRVNRAVVLNLLQRLSDPQLTAVQLEAALSGDVGLSYKLLRYVNSAAFGMRREISSLREAVMLVGVATIRNWATLILIDSVRNDKPQELVRVAMVRAAMCESLAKERTPESRAHYFIAGLFSVLDALMDTPMVRLMDELPVNAEIKLALLNYEGELGAVLRKVVRYEAADWFSLPGAELGALTNAYKEAVRWADENMQQLFG